MSKVKREYRTYSKETYLEFLKDHNLSEKDISYSKYTKILEVCNWMFIEYALRTGSKVNLPYGFGPLVVTKRILKRYKEYKGKTYVNLRVDWNKTKKVGKKIYHTNEHTDGYNFKWLWFSLESKIHLADLYVFKPGRYASRAIAKYVKKKNSQYKEMYLNWSK